MLGLNDHRVIEQLVTLHLFTQLDDARNRGGQKQGVAPTGIKAVGARRVTSTLRDVPIQIRFRH
jgi:hypothetical protein